MGNAAGSTVVSGKIAVTGGEAAGGAVAIGEAAGGKITVASGEAAGGAATAGNAIEEASIANKVEQGGKDIAKVTIKMKPS